jgi:hypothetical protein
LYNSIHSFDVLPVVPIHASSVITTSPGDAARTGIAISNTGNSLFNKDTNTSSGYAVRPAKG